MATDTWTKIDDKIKTMTELNKRQDETAELLLWADNPYELVKPDGKTKLADAISVTPNLPRVFAHGVISDLLSGKWQTVIEGKLSGRQSHTIESFIDDNFAQADELLLERYGIPSLDGWLCNHVCVRWAIGVRWISQLEEKEYSVDCLPVDMRWTPFVLNNWVAPITWMYGDALQEYLEIYEKKAKDGKGGEYTKLPFDSATQYEVRDYWDKEKHELLVASKLRFAEPHKFGKPPFVIAIPASGFMLRDKGYLKHEGEDILFLNAGLYKELARSISLEQTSGYAGLYPAYEREIKIFDGKPSMPVPKIDESQDVVEGGRHQPVPRGDINRAGQTARADIQEMLSNGAPLSPRQYNTPPSAILLAGESEMVQRLQNARKDALGTLRTGLARMMIDQTIKISESGLEVGKQGKRTKYSIENLGNPKEYTISYHLSVKSKRQELANLAEFTAAYGKVPLKWNLTNILMVDDPDGIVEDMEIEQAEADPAIKLYKMARSYAIKAKDMDDNEEANAFRIMSKILTERGVSIIKQRMQPVPQAPGVMPEQPKGNSQLLTQLGGASGALRGEGTRQPEEVIT